MKSFCLLICLFFLTIISAKAQKTQPAPDKDTSYSRVITQRADKIVATLGITDKIKSDRVRDIIAGQYRNLNNIYTERDRRKKEVKADTTQPREKINSELQKIEEGTTVKIDQLHKEFIGQLSKDLNREQVDKVKDGLTYGVLMVTYNAYQDMLPDLTEQQKAQIKAWLVEAREYAMDAESSEKKHAWFGKYKGRINNYLSAAGYDMKKAGEDWQKRRNAAAADKASK